MAEGAASAYEYARRYSVGVAFVEANEGRGSQSKSYAR